MTIRNANDLYEKLLGALDEKTMYKAFTTVDSKHQQIKERLTSADYNSLPQKIIAGLNGENSFLDQHIVMIAAAIPDLHEELSYLAVTQFKEKFLIKCIIQAYETRNFGNTAGITRVPLQLARNLSKDVVFGIHDVVKPDVSHDHDILDFIFELAGDRDGLIKMLTSATVIGLMDYIIKHDEQTAAMITAKKSDTLEYRKQTQSAAFSYLRRTRGDREAIFSFSLPCRLLDNERSYGEFVANRFTLDELKTLFRINDVSKYLNSVRGSDLETDRLAEILIESIKKSDPERKMKLDLKDSHIRHWVKSGLLTTDMVDMGKLKNKTKHSLMSDDLGL